MDERVGLDEGAADDPRGAGELRPDRNAAHSVVMGGAESARLVQEDIRYENLSVYLNHEIRNSSSTSTKEKHHFHLFQDIFSLQLAKTGDSIYPRRD